MFVLREKNKPADEKSLVLMKTPVGRLFVAFAQEGDARRYRAVREMDDRIEAVSHGMLGRCDADALDSVGSVLLIPSLDAVLEVVRDAATFPYERYVMTRHENPEPATVLPYATPRPARPWWVQVGLWGLPGRGSAWLFFWLCTAFGAFSTVRGFAQPGWFWGTGMLLAAFWYWAAIRWVDRHGGWD